MKKIISLDSRHFLRGVGISPYDENIGQFDILQGIDLYRSPGLLQPGYSATDIGGAGVDHYPKWILPYGSYVYVLSSKASTSDIYRFTHTDDISAAGASATFPHSIANTMLGATYFKDTIIYQAGSDLGEISNLSDPDPTINDSKDSMAGQNAGIGVYPIGVGPDGEAYIGDGNDIDKWDGSIFTQAKLVLPVGSVVTALGSTLNYSVAGVSRGLTHTVGDSKIFFWNTWSTTWQREWVIPESPIRGIKTKGNMVYVFAGASLYECSYSNAPKLILGGQNISNLSLKPDTISNAVDLWNGMFLWGDSDTNKIWNYGSPDRRTPMALFNPFLVGSSETIYGIKGITNSKVYVGAGTASTYKLYSFNTGNGNATATTGLIDLKRPYKIHGIKITTMPLASGDSLTINVQNAAGTNIITDIFAYRGVGIETSKYIKTIDTAGANVVTDQIIIDIDYTGNERIKRIDVFGLPEPITIDSYACQG